MNKLDEIPAEISMDWDKAFQFYQTALASNNWSLLIQAMLNLAKASHRVPENILERAVPILVELLNSPSDNQNQNPSIQQVSAYCLQRVARVGKGRLAVVIGQSGAIPCLLRLAHDFEGSQKVVSLKCLRNIVNFGAGNRMVLFSNGGLQAILGMLTSSGDNNVRQILLEILSALALIREARVVIFNSGGSCFLVESARNGSMVSRTRAAQAIGLLALVVKTRSRLIREGAVGALVELIRTGDTSTKKVAANALGVIASHVDYIRPVSEAGAIQAIVGMLEDCGDELCLEISVDVLCVLSLLVENAVTIFPHLIRILKGSNLEAKAVVADVIWDLAGFKHLELPLQSSGVITALIEAWQDSDDVIKDKVSAAFAQLSYNEASRGSLADSGAIPLLIATILEGETEEQRENAAEALVNFAEDPLFCDSVSCVLDNPCFQNMQDRLKRIHTSDEHLESSFGEMSIEQVTQNPCLF